MRYAFGSVIVDGDARQLLRHGVAAHLSGKAFDLLLFLIEQHPRAVSKQEIHDQLWPDTFVGEANLPVLVREIRTAAGHEIIRTVHRFGYAFNAQIAAAPGSSGAHHVLLHAGREFPLARGENIIGRDPAAHVLVPSSSVSRKHAAITTDVASATVSDLGSKNGTRVGGKLIDAPTALRDGDTVTFGAVEMIYRCVLPAAPTETVA